MLFLFANRLRQPLKVNRNHFASKPQVLVSAKKDSKQVQFPQAQSVILMTFVFFAKTPFGAINSSSNLRRVQNHILTLNPNLLRIEKTLLYADENRFK